MSKYAIRLLMSGMFLCAAGLLAGHSVGATPLTAAPPQAGVVAPPRQDFGAFQRVWSRPDYPVQQGRVRRSYTWGPAANFTLVEPWAESPGGGRVVQYWDKARMEITNPGGNSNDPYYVTNGRLVYEMVAGLYQTGANAFGTKPGSQEPVAGDTRSANPEAPSYAAFRGRSSILPGESLWVDRTNQPIVTYMDNTGTIGRADYLAGYGSNYGYYVNETKHNIADKFWAFLNQQGVVYENNQYVNAALYNWVAVAGYPISEPHWITARVGGQPYAVLVQLFERRTLTYIPLFPAEYQVQMGNVGQHYYAWRYGTP